MAREGAGKEKSDGERGTESDLPSVCPLTPILTLLMQSRKRAWADRNRVYDVVRCSSSWDRRDWRAESCGAERVRMSTEPGGRDSTVVMLFFSPFPPLEGRSV
jgi:hypothetical protein